MYHYRILKRLTLGRPTKLNEKKRKSLFAENDSRLCQVVWRKLYGNFIARHNPDKMLAHFARNMGKDIALTRKIDTEHRARQHLSHSAFGDDLFFFRHRMANICRNTCLSRLTTFSPELVQRECWKIFAELLAFPPGTDLMALVHGCEAIPIKHRADVTRRFAWEGVSAEQAAHVTGALE